MIKIAQGISQVYYWFSRSSKERSYGIYQAIMMFIKTLCF